MGDTPPQVGDGYGILRDHLMAFRVLFPSLPMKKTGIPNLVLSLVFLVASKL